jgi:hypothetical protein
MRRGAPSHDPNGRRSPAAPARPAAGGPQPPLWQQVWVRLQQQFWYYAIYFVEGDHQWGQTRLTVAGIVVVLFVVVSRAFEPITELPLLDRLLSAMGLPEVMPPALLKLVEFFASFVTRQTLRHALPPVAGVLLALYFGATYMRDLLELPTLQLALKHLTTTLFGSDYPRMSIVEGKARLVDPEFNPMLTIGGPGWVDIKIGNAAIFERVVGPSSVLGAGTHFIRRFETLREAFDLRELERGKTDIKMMMKDGIPIVMEEMRVRFRIRAREARTEANPYPVMVGAVRRAAYNRKVSARGLDDWPDMVAGAVKGTITGWIAQHRMDELVPPPADGLQPEPSAAPPFRQALHNLFQARETRQKFADMGADIIWVSVGHVRPDPDVDPDLEPGADATGRDKIHQQFIDTWKAKHAAFAQDELADARGYARWLNDTAHAQAEADLILALTTGLREARSEGLAIDDLLTNRLIEYVTGVRLRGEERTASWLTVKNFLEGGVSGDAPLISPKQS